MELSFEVSRELIVPAEIRLDYLHGVLQFTMGWRDSHLHEFQTETKRYGMKLEDADEELLNEKRSYLSAIVRPNSPCFGYIYDYGDEWVHRIEVIDFDCREMPKGRIFYCTAAKGACPPEDVGGAYGYEDFCKAINDPANPEHDEMTEWVYDLYPRSQKWPDGVSLEFINDMLHCCERAYRRETAPKKPKPRRVWVYTGPPKNEQ